jgi:hypothetical protein
MSVSTVSIADLVFRQAIRGDLGQISMDGQMLSVLFSLDGRKTLDEISHQVGMELATLGSILAKLVRLELVERVEIAAPTVDRDFMTFLVAQLSLALGPLGAILVDDAIHEFGCDEEGLPIARCAEFVNVLAEEIRREDKRIAFKEAMLSKIREKSY